MKNWIIVASKDHVKKGITGGFAQTCHGKSVQLKRMRTGDRVIYYSGKEYINKPEKCQQFTAIGEVKGEDIYQVEMNPDFCPFRIDIDFFEAEDVSILPLIDELQFIENKKHWGYPFRWGILEINEHDYKLVADLMLQKNG
ncbi:EVE domain-containing protein [Chondrinema litorale]|uniref:EVE domain-containing protein n=1 Tax=Chondrinema litorale TaxID=2994555 RepID=UPI0025431B9D|nr:EVE domain-containing protein [Chondrinema litorale]UZR97949.1 EVE domain-containing protein [Chondrinema litorale]